MKEIVTSNIMIENDIMIGLNKEEIQINKKANVKYHPSTCMTSFSLAQSPRVVTSL